MKVRIKPEDVLRLIGLEWGGHPLPDFIELEAEVVREAPINQNVPFDQANKIVDA